MTFMHELVCIVAYDGTPLNPLRVFEIAARLGSFTKAADELNVTQPAVSRQIATLENFLNVRLFSRDRNVTNLTPEGSEYYARIAPALQAIASATSDLRARELMLPLRVKIYPTFAVKWLIPRLGTFHKSYPRITIRLVSAVAPVDFSRDRVDVAIQLGSTADRGVVSERLFPDVIQPVCSPALLRGSVALKTIDDIAAHKLLHSQYRMRDWPDWLLAVNRPDVISEKAMTFPSSVLTYQAAIEGLGIAIGQPRLLQSELARGQLMALFTPIARNLAYYALWPADRPQNRGLRSFMAWLRAEVAQQTDPIAPPGKARPSG
ncbi:LysR family transcriptional regulator [Vineibacter terrae]|uniref:LysR family transcriptional regulator n=1 Tax=Vineibacter terrae TaxID=2586908 RepID=A0A5C8PAN3_9HYPH|nr:LysR substrate-binding domain-containing protein [Vineibacter terrae]TXL70629.1 LysR family transcriptional regulator [Vineibacter terrae]